jgi:hypothetical protein
MKLNHRAGFVAHPFAVYIDHLTPARSEHRPKVVMVPGGQYAGGCYLVTAEASLVGRIDLPNAGTKC